MIDMNEMEKSVAALRDQVESLDTTFSDFKEGQPVFRDEEVDPDAPSLDELATSAVVTLHYAYTLVRELREAGAEIAEAPVEEEALMTMMANSKLVLEDMRATCAHIESVVERVRPRAA